MDSKRGNVNECQLDSCTLAAVPLFNNSLWLAMLRAKLTQIKQRIHVLRCSHLPCSLSFFFNFILTNLKLYLKI